MDIPPVFVIFLVLTSLLIARADIVFREEPTDSVVVESQPLSLNCLAEEDQRRGRIVIHWFHNSIQLQLNSDVRLNLLANGTLFITSTQTGDEGTYSCLASVIGSQGVVEQSRSITATLSFAYIESVFYHPSNLTATDQQPTAVNFQCISGESVPRAVVIWEKDGQILGPEYAIQLSTNFGSMDSRMTSGSLQIDNVRMRHAGQYRCITTNPLLPGKKYSLYATLTVVPHPGRPYISEGPSNQIVPLGDPASLTCEILSDPAPVISWFKDGAPLNERGEGTTLVYPNGTLSFTAVRESDEGAYFCNGTNSLGYVISPPATLLTAYIDWNFLQEPEGTTVVEGDVTTLFCRPPISKPAADVTWYKDNQLLAPRQGTAILDVGDLYFSSVTKADEGDYFCVATNGHVPASRTSNTARLAVKVGATLTNPPTSTEVVLGDDLTLTCEAAGDPAPSLTWLMNNVELTQGGRITLGNSGGLLHIFGMTSLDRGTYTCVASNPYGTDRESVYVNVLVPPRLLTSPEHHSTGVGTSILIPCYVVGEPMPVVTWFKDDLQLTFNPPSDHYQRTNDGLFIAEVELSDNGVYVCKAENKVGTVEANGTLTVETFPVFTVLPHNQTLSEEAVVLFECEAEGVPPPTFSWSFNDGPILPPLSLSQDRHRLTVPSANTGLVGIYTCTAENTQGLISASAFLNVRTAPVLEPIPNVTANAGDTITVTCNALYGFPDISFTWLRAADILTASSRVSFPEDNQLEINVRGSDEGVYTCVATNDLGSSRETFFLSVLDIPGVPSIIEVLALSESSIMVTWGAGGDTESYQLEYKLSSSSVWNVHLILSTNGRTNESFIIDDLIENREYEIRVIASNSLGDSPPSTTVNAYTLSVTGPSAPRNLHVTDFNSTSIELEWEIPEMRSGPISVYHVTYSRQSDNGSTTVELPGEDQFTIYHTISRLRPNSVYFFQVCATTSYNDELQQGNCTHYLQQRTSTAAPDAAPDGVEAVVLTHYSVAVSWSAIPESHQNGEILGYNISISSEGTIIVDSVEAPTTSHTIDVLKPWTDYTVAVAGYNADGPGPSSEGVTVKTKATDPRVRPTIVSSEVLNATAVHISWELGDNTELFNGPIDGYTVTWYDLSDRLWDRSTNETEFTISGLSGGTEYGIMVSAYNLVDDAIFSSVPSSPTTRITTPDDVPSRIANPVILQIGPTFIYLIWAPPREHRGTITGYQIEYAALTEVSQGSTVMMTWKRQVEEEMRKIESGTEDASNQLRWPEGVKAVADGEGKDCRLEQCPLAGELVDQWVRGRRQVIANAFPRSTWPEFLDTWTCNIQIPSIGTKNRARRELSAGSNKTHGVAFSKEPRYNLTGLAQATNYSITIMAGTSAGLGEGTTLYLTTDESQTFSMTPGNMETSPGQGSLEKDSISLFGLPLNSFILFSSSVGLAFVFFLLAIIFMTAWCSRASGKRQAKSKLLNRSLLRNDQFVQLSPPSTDEGVDNCSRSDSSPTPSSMEAAPTSSHALDDRELVENRPRASSSPASHQLAVNPSTSRYSDGLPHYGTNPRDEKSRSVKSLDGAHNGMEDLYTKVNRTSRGPGRFQKDSLAAIAALLDQEESDHEGRPPDSPPSVVIADQRTVL